MLGGGHQRRAVFEPRPNLHLRRKFRRVGQHLPLDGDILRDREASKGARFIERRQRLRRRPRQRPAERAPACPQWDRQQIVAAFFKTRARKAYQRATAIDEVVNALLRFARKRADVGQHQHGNVLLQERIQRLRQIGFFRNRQFGIRQKRFLNIVERRQQRLGLLAAFPRDQADAMPLGRSIDQANRASRALARNFNARHLIAQFQRQIEGDRRGCFPVAQFVCSFAQALAARGKRMHRTFARRSHRLRNDGFEFALLAKAGGEAKSFTAPALIDNSEGACTRDLGQFGGDCDGIFFMIDAIVTCYVESMTLAHENMRYPSVRLAGQDLPKPCTDPFADMADDIPWET